MGPISTRRAARAVALLAGAVALAVLLRWALLGIAACVFLLSSTRPGAAARRILGDLLNELWPIAIPLLIVIVASTLQLGAGVQIVAGAAAAAVVVLWLGSKDWRALLAVERRVRREYIARTIGIGLLLLLTYATRSAPYDFEASGGIPAALALGAVYCWIGAVACRLVGFAVGPLRLVVAVALLCALVRLLMDAALVPGDEALSSIPLRPLETPVLLVAAAIALLACVVAEARRPPAASEPPRPGRWAWLRSAGPAMASRGAFLAVAAAVIITLALAGGAIDARDRGGGSLSYAEAQVDEPGAARLTELDDRQLAGRYLPVLLFSDDQPWAPESVRSYIASETITLTAPGRRRVRIGSGASPLPTTCAGTGRVDPCFTLSIRCAAAGDSCSRADPASARARADRDSVAYVRVARRGADAPADGSPDPFERYGPFADELAILVQYWFFYHYDEWVAPVFGGQLVQRHEGDWEAVTVGLSTSRPLFAAYSEHCGGQWRRWRDVDVAGEQGALRSRPVVAVAVGSQANYTRALAGRAPDWSSCKGIPGEAVGLLSYTFNIRDHTADDWRWTPGPEDVRLVRADRFPMDFPGYWGATDATQFVTARPHELQSRPGPGPATPSRQPLWRSPVRQIFCGKAWRPQDCKPRASR